MSNLEKVIKGGLYHFPKICKAMLKRNGWNTYKNSENIDEVEQISLLITCITKLQRYCTIELPYIFGFSPKTFSENPPFYSTFARIITNINQLITPLHFWTVALFDIIWQYQTLIWQGLHQYQNFYACN